MATIKSFTDLQQSKKLAEILPLESADMRYEYPSMEKDEIQEPMIGFHTSSFNWFKESDSFIYFPCWSLSALLNILHSKTKNIPSLTGGGYKDGKYISDWCLDYEFDDGDYQKTFADNPVDACHEMILKLHELNLL